jgi:hypothetical protein
MVLHMRTTLQLDSDVSVMLEDWRARAKLSLREAVNQALRESLARKQASWVGKGAFRTEVVDLGPCRISCLDSVEDALAQAESHTLR